MSGASWLKDDRVVFRLTASDRQVLEAAADATGQPLSAFVRTTSLRAAKRIVRDVGTKRADK